MKTVRPFTLFLLLSLLMVFSACAPPGPPPPDLAAIEAEVRAASEGIAAAESAMDIETALTYWAPDAIVNPANAPSVEGIEAIRALYEAYFGDGGPVAEFESTTTAIHVASSGDMAWEHGVNRMVVEGPDGQVTDMGKYLVVWEKRGDAWKVAALAFSSDAPPPAM